MQTSTAIKFSAAFLLSIPLNSAFAQDGFWKEIRGGVFDHDTSVVGTKKEPGVDYGVELLSRPFDFLSLIGSPGLVVGLVVNSAGKTNQAYFGLAAAHDIFPDVFRTGDAFFLEGTVGITLHDGKLDVRGTPEDAKWKSHGSRGVFRTGVDIGYRFNPEWSLAVSFNHISNANLAHPNHGSNDLGLRLGKRL